MGSDTILSPLAILIQRKKTHNQCLTGLMALLLEELKMEQLAEDMEAQISFQLTADVAAEDLKSYLSALDLFNMEQVGFAPT